MPPDLKNIQYNKINSSTARGKFLKNLETNRLDGEGRYEYIRCYEFCADSA
jgi:hypothetical protein